MIFLMDSQQIFLIKHLRNKIITKKLIILMQIFKILIILINQNKIQS
jgi:hypothetical protein